MANFENNDSARLAVDVTQDVADNFTSENTDSALEENAAPEDLSFYEKLKNGKYGMEDALKYLNSLKWNEVNINSMQLVASVQVLLIKFWFNVWKVDGILCEQWKETSKTMNAIKEIQRKYWLTIDWLPGPATVYKLLELLELVPDDVDYESYTWSGTPAEAVSSEPSFYEKLKNGKYGIDDAEKYLRSLKWTEDYINSMQVVASVQVLLIKFWFNVWKVDGILCEQWKTTSKTMEAIKEIQRKYWLKVDWLPGKKTVKKLLELYYGPVDRLQEDPEDKEDKEDKEDEEYTGPNNPSFFEKIRQVTSH